MSRPGVGHNAHVPETASPIRAAGAVLVREDATGPRVAVIHRPHRTDWTLPKGKVDPGEVLPQTAVREVAEETCLRVTLGAPLTTQEYDVAGTAKTVHYWRANSVAGDFAPTDEVDELRWLPTAEATALLTYSHDRALVAEAVAAPPTIPLLLVRHAHAGDGQRWRAEGREDLLRPLSDRGRKSVPAITGLAHAFGVRRVVTSPAARCTATVAGLRHEVAWEENPWLYDGADIGTPGFNAVIADALMAPEATAVCAHGEQVDWLTAHLGHRLAAFTKGGTLVAHRDRRNLSRVVAFEWYPATRG